MLTHVYKGIHLVVVTFEQGIGTSPAEFPPVECEQSNGATDALYKKTEVTVSDRMLVSEGPARQVSSSRKSAASVIDWTLALKRPDAGWLRLVTLTWSRIEESPSDRTLGVSGRA